MHVHVRINTNEYNRVRSTVRTATDGVNNLVFFFFFLLLFIIFWGTGRKPKNVNKYKFPSVRGRVSRCRFPHTVDIILRSFRGPLDGMGRVGDDLHGHNKARRRGMRTRCRCVYICTVIMRVRTHTHTHTIIVIPFRCRSVVANRYIFFLPRSVGRNSDGL